MKTRWLFLFLTFSLGCSSKHEEEPFQLIRFAQAGREDVFLNEKLIFKFNAWVDSSSINQDSFSIISKSGKRPQGKLQVGREGREVSFIPNPVLDPSLKDGGYQPGEEYEVRISGFPRLNSIRSLSGKILSQGVASRFKVLDPQHLPAGINSPFEDENPTVQFVSYTFNEPVLGEPILLRFSKPVRPDSVSEACVRILENPKNENKALPIRLKLLENQEFAVLSIQVLEDVSPKHTYRLEIAEKILLDFSGNPIHWEEPVRHFRFKSKKE